MRKVCIAAAALAFLGALASVITVAVLGGENSTKPIEIAAWIACAITCAFMTMGASLGAMAFRPTGLEPAKVQAAPQQYPGQHSGPIPQAAPGQQQQQQWPGR
ncbi:hypothetical protein [Alloactinosynnema sp. L-07]|uniref:hypothetical protein n=1 Tax=Alloactinosynnema sp. L-07 TaxID=1653480 RepID=UPI00065EFF49|nr:hypothetical protein [Alloactinosynnema sp. L-07]CRK55872.1 hypothetical protein [Alloactinosynnema sp. L-07]